MGMQKITLYIPSDLLAAYSALARREGRPRAAVMRDALRDFVERQEWELPSWVGALDIDDDVNSTNVKEWLAANGKPD
jgi:predicted transcriptional regulator